MYFEGESRGDPRRETFARALVWSSICQRTLRGHCAYTAAASKTDLDGYCSTLSTPCSAVPISPNEDRAVRAAPALSLS
jgi:hypothetical protein